MFGIFLIKIMQFEKTGSISKIFNSPRNLKIKFHFRKSITFFMTFTILLFDSGVCLPFNQEKDLNLKRNQKSNSEILIFSVNKLRDFFLKKTIATFIKSKLR